MEKTPLISVIVPVYKVERYLPRCIESILKQTYTNFELILVDDGTPDRSGIICDRYAEKDSRIRVIHKENGGVSTARNAGIDVAKGEWITFVDSDDWISNDYLNALVSPLDLYEYDFVMGRIESRSVCVKPFARKEFSILVEEINTPFVLQELEYWEFRGPCCKLFSTLKVKGNEIRFPEGIATGEDDIFVYRYLKHSKSIFSTNKVVYYYNRLNEIAVTRRMPYFPEKNEWDEIYITSIIDIMITWGVNDEFSSNIISKFAGELFNQNVRSSIINLSEEEAKIKILSILPSYEKWLFIDSEWSRRKENAIRRELVNCISDRNICGIYGLLKPKKRRGITYKIKKIIKKIIRPFIEKYRDGLVKFKF